jgi:hypothetical protein
MKAGRKRSDWLIGVVSHLVYPANYRTCPSAPSPPPPFPPVSLKDNLSEISGIMLPLEYPLSRLHDKFSKRVLFFVYL